MFKCSLSMMRGHWSSSAPVPGCRCLWGNGLLLGPSLIGSIQTLSSLMGLFAALLWTQTPQAPLSADKRPQGDTCRNLVVFRSPNISFGLTVCLYELVLDKSNTLRQRKLIFNTKALNALICLSLLSDFLSAPLSSESTDSCWRQASLTAPNKKTASHCRF